MLTMVGKGLGPRGTHQIGHLLTPFQHRDNLRERSFRFNNLTALFLHFHTCGDVLHPESTAFGQVMALAKTFASCPLPSKTQIVVNPPRTDS